MKLTIDMSKEVGSKVKSFEVENCDIDGNKQKKGYYNLLAPDYLTDGGDDYDSSIQSGSPHFHIPFIYVGSKSSHTFDVGFSSQFCCESFARNHIN